MPHGVASPTTRAKEASARITCAVAATGPDVALIDIKMPPTHTDEGLRAAVQIRSEHPDCAVLLLSSYLDGRYASTLLESSPGGCGAAAFAPAAPACASNTHPANGPNANPSCCTTPSAHTRRSSTDRSAIATS